MFKGLKIFEILDLGVLGSWGLGFRFPLRLPKGDFGFRFFLRVPVRVPVSVPEVSVRLVCVLSGLRVNV